MRVSGGPETWSPNILLSSDGPHQCDGQVLDLERDSTCDLKDTDFPGRIWVRPSLLLPPSFLPFAFPSLRLLSLPIRKLRPAHTCLRTHTTFRYAHTLQVSCKLYVPSRANCESAVKGPPLLSPFTKYNTAPLPRPREMRQCLQTFSLRCHIFQVRTRGRACSSAVLPGSARSPSSSPN